jgi:hypothetical protein
MSTGARINGLLGGNQGTDTVTLVTGSQALRIPDTSSVIMLAGSGTPTIATFVNPASARGRLVILYNNSAVNIVVTNNAGTTTAGQFDLGAADITLGPTDVLGFYVLPNGVGVEFFTTDN